jgi:putative DNA methylase
MAAGFSLRIGDVEIRTAEALYQALRFPHDLALQRLILDERSPMTAKMRTKPHRARTRSDWDAIRVDLMRWCLRVKLAENWSSFGDLLLETGDRPIVEESKKDTFWGARPCEDGTLVGQNVLGRLLMELREQLRTNQSVLERVDPPSVPNFVLLGKEIGPVLALAKPELHEEPTLFSETSRKEPQAMETTTVRPPMDAPQPYPKKLIEVALPLEAINAASAREKSIRHGHPSTLHLWWARRPLAAARAVIFAQMVDDPSAWPERFPTEEEQDAERQRLFRIIEELVKWENTTNEDVLEAARAEIRRSWRDTCADNADHPRAAELFDPDKLPGFHDPFCGGGALPLEAQRLGLKAWASDLNPVAVLITKAMIEIPPKFAGRPPVGPLPPGEEEQIPVGGWTGAKGLAEDVRRYGAWMRAEAEKRIGHLYPKVLVTAEMARERPDLEPYVGRELTVIAWLWARTVKSPNPAFADVGVPLVSTFMLSTKAGKEAYVEPVIEDGGYRFTVKVGAPPDPEAAKRGTKLARGPNFRCVMSDAPIGGDYIKAEGVGGRMGARLMAIVAEGDRGRVYLAPGEEHPSHALEAKPSWRPESTISGSTQYLGVKPYGMERFSQLFTDRQLVALTTFSDLVQEARERVRGDALVAGLPDDETGLDDDGGGATAYADAVALYLGIGLSRLTDICNALCRWEVSKTQVRNLFGRQAIPMLWDFAENNVFAGAAGDFATSLGNMVKAVLTLPGTGVGDARQLDAQTQELSANRLIATDPPYYDNVPYADLSDFFYVWLRRSLQSVFPTLFSTLATPKSQELVAAPYRQGGRAQAEAFFVDGMTVAIQRLAEQAHPAFPTTIYYAFKQAETDGQGTTSTGWETFLEAVMRAGFAIAGTWPMRTELGNRMRGMASNALASSVVLVCRPQASQAGIATRRDFLQALKAELPDALRHLQHGNIAPVDLAQSAIGPGMAIYTRYAKVIDADGSPLSVRDALGLVNQTLDEVLAEQEGEFDADTRWAVTWFEQHGFAEGAFGDADNISRAKGTSVEGMVRAGIVESGRGKVRLLRPAELPAGWDPVRDERLTVWEATHHLLRALDEGEQAAADLARRLGGVADAARDLAYRLYVACERCKRAQEALAYNGLVQSWPEIQRLATGSTSAETQETLDV